MCPRLWGGAPDFALFGDSPVAGKLREAFGDGGGGEDQWKRAVARRPSGPSALSRYPVGRAGRRIRRDDAGQHGTEAGLVDIHVADPVTVVPNLRVTYRHATLNDRQPAKSSESIAAVDPDGAAQKPEVVNHVDIKLPAELPSSLTCLYDETPPDRENWTARETTTLYRWEIDSLPPKR